MATSTVITYDDQDNTLTTAATTNSLLTTGRYHWDTRGRLTGLGANDDGDFDGLGDATYGYSSSGLRVSARYPEEVLDALQENLIVVSASELMLWDPLNATGYAQVIEERRRTDGVATSSSPVSGTFTIGKDLETSWAADAVSGAFVASHLVNDPHGSVRTLTTTRSESGGRTETFDYDGFGRSTYKPLSYVGLPATTPLGYAGEWKDDVVKAQFHRSRWNRADAGGWLSRDRAEFGPGETGDANLYVYVGGDPGNRVDPTGMFSVGQLIVTAGLTGAILGGTAGASIAYATGGSVIRGAVYGSIGGSALGISFARGPIELGKTLSSAVVQASSNVAGEFLSDIGVALGSNLHSSSEWKGRYANSFFEGFATGAAAAQYGGILGGRIGDDYEEAAAAAVAFSTTLSASLLSLDWKSDGVVKRLAYITADATVDGIIAFAIAQAVPKKVDLDDGKIRYLKDAAREFGRNVVVDFVGGAAGVFLTGAKANFKRDS